jgi:hypothetical protein
LELVKKMEEELYYKKIYRNNKDTKKYGSGGCGDSIAPPDRTRLTEK